MDRAEATAAIIAAKRGKALRWSDIAAAIGTSKEWAAAACLGQLALCEREAESLAGLLGLPAEAAAALQAPPCRGFLEEDRAADPLIYLFHELVSVYGTTLQELISEEFGDGIMSTVGFSMSVGREPDPGGDRVKVVMSGKFLPYRRR